MTFEEFKQQHRFSMESICRDFYHANKNRLKIKKEEVVVRNLSNIVETTLAISIRKGFDAMSLRDLSRESGLSMGALYSYFASKEELLYLIQDFGQRTVKTHLEAELRDITSPLEKLRAFIRAHLYLSELMQQWFYFFFMETRAMDKQDRKRSIESELMTEKIVIEILQDGKAAQVFSIQDELLTAGAIKALMQDWYLKRWKFRQRNVNVDMYADYITGMIETSILDT